jgi:hypothetical protein
MITRAWRLRWYLQECNSLSPRIWLRNPLGYVEHNLGTIGAYIYFHLLENVAYLLTPRASPWEANRFSASQKILGFLWNPSFITAFTTARSQSLSWAISI